MRDTLEERRDLDTLRLVDVEDQTSEVPDDLEESVDVDS